MGLSLVLMDLGLPFALLSLPNGSIVCGFGLHSQQRPTASGVYFWSRPFFSGSQYFAAERVKYFSNINELLSDGRMVELLAGGRAGGAQLATTGFGGPDRAIFDEDFETIQSAIGRGDLKKAVPVAFESAKLKGGPEKKQDARSAADLVILGRLLGFYASLPETQRRHLFLYAWIDAERSFMGLSPEFLLQSCGQNQWRSMALAGSCGLGEEDSALLANQKERQEHQYVIDDIAERLSTLGLSPHAEQTHVARYPRLKHLRTYINWMLPTGVLDSSDPLMGVRVAEALHPTAALGVYPRTPEAQQLFEGLRSSRDRGYLGAPIGFVDSDRSIDQVTVAIRGIERRADELWLGSGCGVVADSEPNKEWSELALKRSFMKQILGLI